MKLTLHVSGEPVAQPRPKARAFMVGPNKARAQIYDPGGASQWKALIRAAAAKHLPPEPLRGPIKITATFFFPRPASHFNKSGLTKAAPRKHIQRPDFDNCIKAVTDALTDARLWHDDAMIDEAHIRKHWAQKNPGVVIEIESEEQQPDLTLADAAKE